MDVDVDDDLVRHLVRQIAETMLLLDDLDAEADRHGVEAVHAVIQALLRHGVRVVAAGWPAQNVARQAHTTAQRG